MVLFLIVNLFLDRMIVRPIIQVSQTADKISVGKGTVAPVTKAIQKEFYAIVHGEKADRHNWFTPVPVRSKQPVSV